MYKYQGNTSVFYGKEQDNVSSLWGFTGQASQHRKRTFLSEKSVMQTSTRSCRYSCSLSWMRQTWLSDDALLYSDILIYHSLRGGSHPWIHTLPHTHTWAGTVPLPLFLVPAHTHARTPAGWGGAKSQESCGLINYHLKETKVGPPEVAAFPSNCSKAVSWKVKNTFKSLGARTETRRPWDCYSNFPACTLEFRHLKSVNLTFTSDVFYSCFLSSVTTLSLNFSDGNRTFVLQNRHRVLLSIFSVY